MSKLEKLIKFFETELETKATLEVTTIGEKIQVKIRGLVYENGSEWKTASVVTAKTFEEAAEKFIKLMENKKIKFDYQKTEAKVFVA